MKLYVNLVHELKKTKEKPFYEKNLKKNLHNFTSFEYLYLRQGIFYQNHKIVINHLKSINNEK